MNEEDDSLEGVGTTKNWVFCIGVNKLVHF